MTCQPTPPTDIFADLEDDHYWADAPSQNTVPFGARVAASDLTAMPAGPQFKERCSACQGSGRWYGGSNRAGETKCFRCKGAGFKVFRTDAAARMKARAKAEGAKVAAANDIAAQARAWAEAHADLYAWMRAKAPRFDFAATMCTKLAQYGFLTPAQQATVERMAAADKARDEARSADRAAVVKAAPSVSIAAIETAFSAAKDAGIKAPKLRLAGFKFSPAKAHSANAGAIYVVDAAQDEYLGKIVGGKFVRSFKCEAVTEAKVLEVCADPEQAAVAYGKQFGQCACCGRELSDPESVARGIGPICAGRFGWGA
jgi:Family of unknown function (DUF6011)